MNKYLLLIITCAFFVKGNAQKSLGIVFHKNYFNQVVFVYKKGPADIAGILPGDRVARINGKEMTSSQREGFVEYLRALPDDVVLEVYRNGSLKTISIKKEEAANFVNKCVEGDCINGTGIFNSGGSSYQGQFTDGKRNGTGTYYFTNGDVYTGQIKNDVIEGKGNLKNSNMEYEGEFANNAYEGSGKITLSNGDFLTAVFSNNKIIGTAKMVYKNGDTYEGAYENYKRNGFGILKYASGGVYEGNFVDNSRHGKGKMIQADKFVYEGGFENDNYGGKGKLTYPDGSIYYGSFKENKPDGPGKMVFYNGDIYKGLFTDFEMTGKGMYWFKNGRFYEGDFEKGKMHGKGKYTWPNGNTYEGDYVDNQRSGNGKYYDKIKNTTKESLWSEDKEVQMLDPKLAQNHSVQFSNAVKDNAAVFEKVFKEANNKFSSYKGTDSLIKNGIIFYDYKGPKFWEGFPKLFRNTSTGKLILSFEIKETNLLTILSVKLSTSDVVQKNGLQKIQEPKNYNGEETNSELYSSKDKLYFGITEFSKSKKIVVAVYE